MHTKYKVYEAIANNDGYYEVADYFGKVASDELGLAQYTMGLLDKVGDTRLNLEKSFNNVNDHTEHILTKCASDAGKEGFDDISEKMLFKQNIKKHHKINFKNMIDDYDNNRFFNNIEAVSYHCANCGYEVTEPACPELCPLCNYPRSSFYRV